MRWFNVVQQLVLWLYDSESGYVFVCALQALRTTINFDVELIGRPRVLFQSRNGSRKPLANSRTNYLTFSYAGKWNTSKFYPQSYSLKGNPLKMYYYNLRDGNLQKKGDWRISLELFYFKMEGGWVG